MYVKACLGMTEKELLFWRINSNNVECFLLVQDERAHLFEAEYINSNYIEVSPLCGHERGVVEGGTPGRSTFLKISINPEAFSIAKEQKCHHLLET